MKNLTFKPTNLVYNILVLGIILEIIGVSTLYAVPLGLAFGLLLGFFKSPVGALFAPIQKEIWEKDIQGNLYKSNAFLKTFSAADKDNINGRTVHIPQAGKGGNVEKNRSVLPAQIKKRTDTVESYQINEFTSDPILIPHADTVELSYAKRESALQEEQSKLNQEVAEDTLISIVKSPVGTVTDLPQTSILSTNSEIKVPATAIGATGLVKAYSLDDLQRGRTFFVRQNSWTDGKMYALITAEAEAQMFPANSVVTATYMASVTEEERRNGVMYKAYGFQIITRSSVYTLNEAGAFKPSGAVGAATDVEGVVFYNGNQVEFALGDIEFFGNEGRAEYYGDVYSFLARSGARPKRANYEGVLVVKQAPTA
ncbi:hypothetical protein [Sphingobacterium siyangense]|uniref:hypothetical protein n=1 Tax=Sphingobacterium siyangense TaxID=459529 RepID=UPI003018877F